MPSDSITLPIALIELRTVASKRLYRRINPLAFNILLNSSSIVNLLTVPDKSRLSKTQEQLSNGDRTEK